MSFIDKIMLKDTNGVKFITFPNALNESNPGSPELPSKIVFVAIPPKSKATISLSNQQYSIYQDVSIEANPKLVKLKDSTLVYVSQNLQREYFQTDQYPSIECQVIGYMWLRDYYCAIIKINSSSYNWKLRQLKLLISASLNVNFNQTTAFIVNKTEKAPYDSVLKKIILNYNYADNFRSFQKSFIAQDTTGLWINYSNDYVKLSLINDGIYKIGFQDLVKYGLDPAAINPSTIKIYCKGNQLPLYISSSQPGVFSPNDYVEFWATRNYGSSDYRNIVPVGTDYLNYMNRYTDTTYIWLTWGGDTTSYRVNIDSLLNSSVTDTLTSYLNKSHFEKDVRLWYYGSVDPRVQLPYWQENKVWTWIVMGTGSIFSLPFNASNIVPNTNVNTYIRLISNGADIQQNAHVVGAGLNTNSIQDTITFNYEQTVNFNSTFPSSSLINGANNLKVTGLPTQGTFQQFLIDWIDVDYYRYLSASNDSLYFQFPDTLQKKLRVIKIANTTLADSDYVLWKVKPDTVKIQNFIINGSTNKYLTLIDTVSGGDAYVLLSNQYIKSPTFIGKKKFTNLRSTNLGADDIIISNRVLTQSANSYNQFIQNNYNVRTVLIFVNDIYDEFSYGYPDPESIRSFLLFANGNWVPPSPSYLTLIGDANYDYKNLWSPVPAVRKQNLVPSYGYPVSDAWYSMWDTSQVDIPQMFTGRIPAANDQQVLNYLAKYSEYLNRPYDKWNKTFLFFSGGDPNTPGQINQLKSVNDYIFSNDVKPKPIGGTGYHFYKTTNPSTNFGPYTQTTIQDAINYGSLFISYIGHSGTQTWDNGITDVDALKNSYSDRFPLITDFGCSTGKFAEPDVTCFGELFTTGSTDGQAIAYLSNSSWGYISTAVTYPTYFYAQMLKDSVTSVAKAHVLAKIQLFNNGGYSDVNTVFAYDNVMLGDPLLNLRLPSKPNLVITSSDIVPMENIPSDQEDNIPINIHYHNYGIVPNDTVQIAVKDIYNNSVSSEQYFKVPIPLLDDSLIVNVPIKNKVGVHNLTVIIDSANVIDEIYKNDNQASLSFTVYSITLRAILGSNYYSTYNGEITFLNPTYANFDTTSSKFDFQVDTSQNFSAPVQHENNLGLFTSSITVPNLSPQLRYWWRAKLSVAQTWSAPSSLTNLSGDYNWYINSPIDSLSDIKYSSTGFNSSDKAWELNSQKDELKISSAGNSDGSFASMQYNLTETLPATYFWGIATALIDTITLRPYNFKTFVYPNPPAGDSLLSYLQGFPNGTVIAMAICDDGAQSVLGFSAGTPVRDEIKNWGSIYIDSVQYRESWCIIGKKGAAPGTVPEAYKKLFAGVAIIDTSIIAKSDSGTINFPDINYSSNWDSLRVGMNVPSGASISFTPIGITQNNTMDTLSTISLNNGVASLSNIDANKYHSIQLLAKLKANADRVSPQISSIAVKYALVPELGTNYQLVKTDMDSLIIGQSIKLDFSVMNVGQAEADSFKVRVEVVHGDNTKEQIMNIPANLAVGSKKGYSIVYTANSFPGPNSFLITIDPDNKIVELFKDNNSYNVPFYVKADSNKPVVNITFDGREIINNDYISSHPKIQIELNDPSFLPISDTSSISIHLDNEPVYYSGNSANLSYKFNSANPKMVVIYTPELSDGDHSIEVSSMNSLSVKGLEVIKNFTVSSEPKILDVYNYPDPFSNETYFTFKLTQIPDQLKIRIFTIAGRLIKELTLHSSDLNYDFNRIYWDGRDADGDIIANGVYLYKIIMSVNGKVQSVTQKLAVVR
jgi:Peptidase family C25/Interleukin-like EMT inducer/CARDB/Propeptide_C25